MICQTMKEVRSTLRRRQRDSNTLHRPTLLLLLLRCGIAHRRTPSLTLADPKDQHSWRWDLRLLTTPLSPNRSKHSGHRRVDDHVLGRILRIYKAPAQNRTYVCGLSQISFRTPNSNNYQRFSPLSLLHVPSRGSLSVHLPPHPREPTRPQESWRKG